MLENSKTKPLDWFCSGDFDQCRHGKVVVLCHGTFDLIHPGHLVHLNAAKSLGDILVVSVTGSRYVNKGPGRPLFNDPARLISLASLEFVDFVTIVDEPSAIMAINKVRPEIYCKGAEYRDSSSDVTFKIDAERELVEELGGIVKYTEGETFSSSNIINNLFTSGSAKQRGFVKNIQESYGFPVIRERLENLEGNAVTVIGESIFDSYIDCTVLGLSSKHSNLVVNAKGDKKELHLGGILAVGSHLTSLVGQLQIISSGKKYTSNARAEKLLNERQLPVTWVEQEGYGITEKVRYRDASDGRQLFETYENYPDNLVVNSEAIGLFDIVADGLLGSDCVIAVDYGHGLIDNALAQYLGSYRDCYVAVNAQVNSANRGFNSVLRYAGCVDLIAINETELKVAIQDQAGDIDELAARLLKKLSCKELLVTRGVEGCTVYWLSGEIAEKKTFPALIRGVPIDRVGAGDAFLAIYAVLRSTGAPLDLAVFVASIGASIEVSYLGNKYFVDKVRLLKAVETSLK